MYVLLLTFFLWVDRYINHSNQLYYQHNNFKTASEAFHDLYWRIVRDGVDFAGTKALFNVGFEIEVPNANAILDSKVKPAVTKDGGDIKFISFNEGVVKVELRGSCSGCPSSLMTLKQCVQNWLKHYVKEVQSVEAI